MNNAGQSSSAGQVKRIANKLNELVRRYELLQAENQKLQAELMPAKQRELRLLEQIGQLEQKVTVLKTVTGTISEEEKKQLDKKLSGYLKEIDRCINMLSE